MALDIENYRNRLIEERDRLSQGIGTVAEVAGPVPDDRQVTAANAPIIAEVTDVENTIIDMKSNRLESINAALQSIDDGTYGKCIECGREINPQRLDADPAALLCIDDARKESEVETPSL
jgi:DnaK suppressor protein